MVLTPSQMVDLGSAAPDFALPDTDGNTVSRGDFVGKPLLAMFICNHCPFVKHIRESLASVSKEYQAKGVTVVAISSNDVKDHPDDSPLGGGHNKARSRRVPNWPLDGDW